MEVNATQVAPQGLTLGGILACVGMVAVTITAIIGNLCIFIVIIKMPNLRSQLTYLFTLNLFLLDFLNALFILPITIVNYILGRWVFGALVCSIHGCLTTAFMFASILSLCAISIERYYSIQSPMHYAAHMTLNRTLSVIAYVWIHSLILAMLPLFGWNSYKYRPSRVQCSYSWDSDVDYVAMVTVLSFILPGILMVIMYSAIFRIARKAAKTIHPVNPSHRSISQINTVSKSVWMKNEKRHASPNLIDSGCDVNSDVIQNGSPADDPVPPNGAPSASDSSPPQNIQPKPQVVILGVLTASDGMSQSFSVLEPGQNCTSRKIGGHWKAVKTLLLIMTIFFALWAPYFIVSLMDLPPKLESYPDTLEMVISWLGFSSYAINPFIYGWLNRSVREALVTLMEEFKASLFPSERDVPDLNPNEDFFQFLERTSVTRTLSIPHSSRAQTSPQTPTIAEE